MIGLGPTHRAAMAFVVHLTFGGATPAGAFVCLEVVR